MDDKDENKDKDKDKDKEEGEETENENLRELILQQFANLESSETSDDDSYKVRLSCILEDDESESSGAAHKDFPKEVEKDSKRDSNQESEKGPPGAVIGVLSESLYDSGSDDFAGEHVQITDLDDVTLCEKDKTDETTDESEKNEGFAIKKLKSSDNLHKRPIVVRRRELSSDSSDLDISVTNSAEGPSSDLKIVEMNEGDEENTLNITGDNVYVESETSADEDLEQKMGQGAKSAELEVVDNETLAPIFAKVSRTYLEKTKGNVKWEENEKIDKIFRELIEEEVKKRGERSGEHLSIQDVHIRGTSRNESNPPIPPETYLWEELKRLRERGGYPWTYLDKPPFDEATWKKYMEHVYEPINPPPQSAERKPETSPEIIETRQSQGSSIPDTDKQQQQQSQQLQSQQQQQSQQLQSQQQQQLQQQQFTRIPSKVSLSKKDSVEESKTSEEIPSEDAQELQERLESRFLAPSPSATSDTTASLSKTDVTSTVLDTSEFEELPAKPGTLGKTRREQVRAHAAEIQQRLRNHAGRIRNKFNNIQRPNLGRKDRLKRETGEKSRFKLPEMHAPKISLPDRSKFKLPEKAKFHLPESSRFHLPDRSKFHLPERSKFGNIAERAKMHLPERPKFGNIAERAKIHLPERGKFHLPDRSKFHLPDKSKFHLPDKSKFHLPDKSKFHLPDRSKFHLPDTSKFHLPEKAKFSLPNRPKIDLPNFKRSASTSDQSPSKSRFDFDLKSYPKLFTKHSKEYMTSSPKQTRGRTPPPRMQPTDVQQSKNWGLKLDEMKYADDDLEEAGMRETDSRKSESLFEKDIGYMEDLEKVPTLSTKSSTSRLSEMSDDRKKGVLEEINADEFFLRQKGISQDDIDMGQYLSREIREAFRSPDVNALAKMDYMDDENLDPRYHGEPKRPKRGPVKKKSILKKSSTSDPSIADDGYKTYPPRRPGRKSRSQSKSLLNEDAVIAERADVDASMYDNDDLNLSRYDNVEYDEDELSEYYKTPGPAREYQHYKVPRSHAPVCPSPPVKRKSSLEDDGSNKRVHEAWDEEEFQATEPPKPMTRRKKDRKKAEEQQQQELQEEPIEVQEVLQEELQIPREEQIPLKTPEELKEVVPEPQVDSPVPPKRTRTRSSGSRSLRSLAAESDVNRSFHSEPGRAPDRLDMMEDEIAQEERQLLEESLNMEFAPPRSHVYEVTDLDDPGFGYATIGKPTVPKPERQKKPDRPPPPRRKKEISVPVYNTYPRRAPVRPLRNYSTLGPSRPPRQKKIPPIERSLAERQSRAYAEIKNRYEDAIDVEASSVKDLQTEKVIEKMKGRPLPPPPRPPRQKSKGPEEEPEPTEEEKLSLSILRDEEFPLERKVTAFVHEAPFERETVEETCTATQTDPLPEDFSFGTEESDIMPEFSHEQLKIQQAFLEEMKKEEEELRQRAGDENDLVDAELKAEVIRQIEDIIAEEKRIMERKNEERKRKEESEQKDGGVAKPKDYLDVDADMGYASLERRGHRQEPASRVAPELPPKVNKLHVKELEVETLNVQEVQSDQIFVKELQGNRIASPDIDNRGGTIALGTMDLPPGLIDQIVAKIPWDSLRQPQEPSQQSALPTPPIRPQRKQQRQTQDDSDDETLFQPRKSHRRPRKHSTDEEDRRSRRQHRGSDSSNNIPELGLQLARACTSASVQALKSFAQTNASIVQSLDRELCVQTVLCIAIALIAGFFLFGFDAKIVHTHRWDFQFPPQPPNAGF